MGCGASAQSSDETKASKDVQQRNIQDGKELLNKPLIGYTVWRGPDWKWGDQDGGGLSGLTIEGASSGDCVRVRWENGNEHSYRVGAEGQYDLIIDKDAKPAPHIRDSGGYTNPPPPAAFWPLPQSANDDDDEDCDDTNEVSLEEDMHIGIRFPRVSCRDHPGCMRRFNCWYSHGLVRNIAPYDPKDGPPKCFLGQPPHNQRCCNPARDGEPFEFCSQECREKAAFTRKGPLGCRRANCPCPVTINGLAGQFCCEACKDGVPCESPIHVRPGAHLIVVAKPQSGKYSPCARSDCACAVEGGSSWDGNEGQFCCKACRNGTPCTQLWHTLPLQEAMAFRQKQYTGECVLEGCNQPASESAYCCEEHRQRDATVKAASPEMRSLAATIVPGSFPDFVIIWPQAEQWARKFGSVCTRGRVTNVWLNESLIATDCPARTSFEKAVSDAQLPNWDGGEFAFHGTKSRSGVEAICWGNLDTGRRSGQALGPGEYFTRGQGMHISEQYAGGDAANLMIVFWIMAHTLGAAPYGWDKQNTNPNQQWMCAALEKPDYSKIPLSQPGKHHSDASGKYTGIIVCNNPVTNGNRSTGAMYCVPLGVVAYGPNAVKPNFRRA